MAFRNIGVFRGSETIRYHLDQFKTHTPNEWCVYDDLGHFFNSGHPVNIAFFHLPYPFQDNTQDTLDRLRTFCNHVFVVGSELHDITARFIENNDHKNITFYICGRLNFKLVNAEVYEYYDWFETSRYFYKSYLPEILQRLKPGPIGFDILLGRKKAHRDFVYKFSHNLPAEQKVVSYFNRFDVDFATDTNMWTWEQPGLKFINTPKWTVDTVEYFGHRMSLSQVIPIDLYNQTRYSVVAETNYNNSYSFYTEKRAKPIIAKRMFIMFAGQHYLKNLRDIGFHTFDNVIDESYDSVEDAPTRWSMACEQMIKLLSLDPDLVAEKIQPRVEHNFGVMMYRGWLSEYISNMEIKVGSILEQT